MELRIVAGAIAPDVDRTTVVSVYDDGCAQVHRPAYRRDAGDYRIDLDKATLDALRGKMEQPALRTFDAKRLRSEVAAASKKNAANGEQLTEQDADYYEIRWRSAGKQATAGWSALPSAALQYADNATLQQMSKAAQALEAIAGRADAARIAGGTP